MLILAKKPGFQVAGTTRLNQRMTLLPGARLGPYEITGAIGAGGMGEVFRARDTKLNRDVAIKVLPREMLHDPQFRGRFDRELKIVAGLEHPAIVPVYDVGEEDGQPYFVMRFMTGGSLSDLIA